MKCFVELDTYADIIEIPESVAIKIKKNRTRFLKWIYDPKNNHGCWVEAIDRSGKPFMGLRYGSEEFVDWLNRYVIKDKSEKAEVVESNLDVNQYDGVMLKIFF